MNDEGAHAPEGGINLAKPVYVKFEMPKDLADKTYELVELARDTGKIRKGTNEVTKLVERGETLMVVLAEDVSPPEILMHMPALCEERNVPYAYVPSKAELGNACGLEKPTAAVAILDAAKGKPMLDDLAEKLKALKK
jgi:large subunit ribosomal protein L7Ae